MSGRGPTRITIDPGSGYTGVALWDASPGMWGRAVPPLRTALLRSRVQGKDVGFEDRATDIGLQLDQGFLVNAHVVEVASEFPELFDNAGSLAAGVRGSWQKLAFTVGCFAMVAAQHGVAFRPIPVREWKGQLSKDMVNRRIVRVLGARACEEFRKDIWDAVGIGMWLKGLL